MTTTQTDLDFERVGQFAGEVMGLYRGGMLTFMIALGHRTGLFESAAAGPATSAELADRAGLQERYVREWLGAMTTGGIFDYDAATGVFTLPAEHALCLTGNGSGNIARISQMVTHLGQFVGPVERVFREGGGVPYSEYYPDFIDLMDAMSRNVFDEHLIAELLPLVPGLTDRLEAGARVADIGCGTGHAIVVMARAFPRSTFVGYDTSEPALTRARAEAVEAGLTNATFERRDVAALGERGKFDAVVSFDTIHDQADPAAVLQGVHDALVPGGSYLMVEPFASSNLEDNVQNPMGAVIYSVSTLHCLTVSLAQGGAGLGTAFGEQKARELLTDAGFTGIAVHPAPGDPMDGVFVAHKER